MFLIIRIMMILVLLAALHFYFNIHKKTQYVNLLGVVLGVYFIHNAFYFAVYAIDIERFGYLDRAAPFSLFYGPLLYFIFLIKTGNELTLKTILLNFSPVLLFWILFLYFAIDSSFRLAIISWYYPLFYSAIGLSLFFYTVYVLIAGQKLHISRDSVYYFSWFCLLSGVFMMLISYRLLTTSLHLSYVRPPESSAVTVAIFMCIGALILVSESFQLFRNQYFPEEDKIKLKSSTHPAKRSEPSEVTRPKKLIVFSKDLNAESEKIESFFRGTAIKDPTFNLKQAALGLDLSQKALTDQISKYYSATFAQLLAAKRVELACNILESSNFNREFDSLASLCGFRSTATFYRNFRQFKGCSPSQYLAQIENDPMTSP